MNLKARLQEDMKAALRAREPARLTTIRLMIAEIKQREIDGRIALDDAAVLVALEKMAKQRRESIAQFEKAGRDDLVAKEQAELALIQEYLPQPLSAEALDTLIDEVIAATGATSVKDMGKVMAILKERAQGRVSMADASQRVKLRLSA
jgi:uncharacterized protein YqeY